MSPREQENPVITACGAQGVTMAPFMLTSSHCMPQTFFALKYFIWFKWKSHCIYREQDALIWECVETGLTCYPERWKRWRNSHRSWQKQCFKTSGKRAALWSWLMACHTDPQAPGSRARSLRLVTKLGREWWHKYQVQKWNSLPCFLSPANPFLS